VVSEHNGTTGDSGGVATAEHDGQAPDAPVKKRRGPSKKVLIIAAVVVVVLALIGGGALLYNSSQYVSTDNAQVDGDQILINAPTTGTLVDWEATQGSEVHRNQIVGRIQMDGSGAQIEKVIRAPGDGTIASNPTIEGQWVTAGSNLATGYDTKEGIYVTARVDETDISDVHPGALVDIDVDAYSDAHVTGVVSEIQNSAAGVFSLFPESNSSGNFQKVTQVIPVRVAFTNTDGVPLAPGMNVTVHIHKH
jgi:multidrug resistance efflux pump